MAQSESADTGALIARSAALRSELVEIIAQSQDLTWQSRQRRALAESAQSPCDTPGMADATCVQCKLPIVPTNEQTTIGSVAYRAACWAQKTRREP